MGKYDGLGDFLRHHGTQQLMMSFDEIARLVPGGLPPSAYAHPAWWANDRGGSHRHALAWLGCGYHTIDVDLPGRRVTFAQRETPTPGHLGAHCVAS